MAGLEEAQWEGNHIPVHPWLSLSIPRRGDLGRLSTLTEIYSDPNISAVREMVMSGVYLANQPTTASKWWQAL